MVSVAKYCEDCTNEISTRRLQIIPGAIRCVSCQEKAGVPLIRRYDDTAMNGEIQVSTYYMSDNNMFTQELNIPKTSFEDVPVELKNSIVYSGLSTIFTEDQE